MDQALQWYRVDGDCMTRPIHMWLIGSYTLAMTCYMCCATFTKQCKQCQLPDANITCVPETSGDSTSKRMLLLATVLPLSLFVWCGLGVYWLDDVLGSETPCVQNNGH